jgi:hypothetical protein
MKPDKRLVALLGAYLAFIFVIGFLEASPALSGLSTTLGTILLGTTVLGTTVLSSVLGSSLLGTTTMIAVYTEALATAQLYVSLICIGLLIYLELTDPTYGGVKKLLLEVRESWTSIATLLVVLFLIFVAFKVWLIITT